MRDNLYLIEVWRSPDGEHWLAECEKREHCKFSSWEYAKRHFSRENWRYWFGFEGKTATAIVVSHEAFERKEALYIAGLIISGKGVKAWKIDLT